MKRYVGLLKAPVRWALDRVLGTVVGVDTEEPLAALTFDDGPHPEYTPRVLDILERYGALGTFFMVGKAAVEHRNLVKRVAEAGHAIGNHSWDHPSFPLLRAKDRRAQIRSCSDALAPYGAKLFRPPFGNQSVLSYLSARMLGYEIIAWSLEVRDWVPNDPEWIAERLKTSIRPGCIVLLHDRLFVRADSYCSREPMLTAVNSFLREASVHYRFVTVPMLLKAGRPRRRRWLMPPDLKFLDGIKNDALKEP
ncbi:MAG TPA: polysaccharide deacetylase family protein [candidate division Zixibacteria bacterium]|nr:polysaccharide deacetylase family protein [candidate division Zixibacteria bacterium]